MKNSNLRSNIKASYFKQKLWKLDQKEDLFKRLTAKELDPSYISSYSNLPKKNLLAVDTETTGNDFKSGCKPFFVSTCDSEGVLKYWEFPVDPYTREPFYTLKQIQEIEDYLQDKVLIFHNTKFDLEALASIGILKEQTRTASFWENIQDTLIASHVIDSHSSHSLKDLAKKYLKIDDDDQKLLQEITNKARREAKKLGWRIAAINDPHFPGIRRSPDSGWWVLDTWLPKTLSDYYKENNIDPPEGLENLEEVCKVYANRDVERTIALYLFFLLIFENEESLTQNYLRRKKLLRVTYEMEQRGITLSTERIYTQIDNFSKVRDKEKTTCETLVEKNLHEFNVDSSQDIAKVLYRVYRLPVLHRTKPSNTHPEGQPSTDKVAVEKLLKHLEKEHRETVHTLPAYTFLTSLTEYKAANTALTYLESYLTFSKEDQETTFRKLYPHFNITGTKTTRFSSSNPNAQNISKLNKSNLRYSFGPSEERVWFAMDYENIEMRIFGYISEDKKLIRAFEEGESVHLIFAEMLYPEEYRQCIEEGVPFNKKYKATLYQWIKNGDFSLIYGAGREKADLTYHVTGAYQKIRRELPLIDNFMKGKSNEAKEKGYITTLEGYRLYVPSSKAYAAVNYFIQGSAGECISKAMIRCFEYLLYLQSFGVDANMVLTIHDELVFDFPKYVFKEGKKYKVNHQKYVSTLIELMEKSGTDINIPLPVSCDKITEDWSQAEDFERISV